MFNPLKTLRDYFISSKEELEKVSWPTQQDTVRYSAVVISVSIIVAAFFALLDTGLNKGVQGLIEIRQSIPTQTPTKTPDIVPDIEAVTASGTPAQINARTLPINATTSSSEKANTN